MTLLDRATRLTAVLRTAAVGRTVPYACATIVSALASIALVILLTRRLAAGEYGLYATVTGVAMIAQSGGYLVWQTSIIRFYPRAAAAEERRRLATAIRIAFLVTTLTIVGLWGAVTHWLGATGVTPPLALAGVALLAARGWLSLVQAWNRVGDRLWRYAGLEALQSAGGLALVIVALHLRPGDPAAALWASALAVLVAGACAPALLLVPVRTDGTARLLRELFRYGGPLMLVSLAGAALAVSDRLIVAAYAGPAAAGAYAVAFSIADRSLNLALLPVALAINPRLFAAWEHDRTAALRLIDELGRRLLLVGLPLVTVLVVAPGPIARLVAGETLARDAARFVPWLAVGSYLAVLLTLYFALAFQLTRRTHRMIVVVGIPAACNVAANLLAVPRYGAYAAAVTTVASYALAVVLAVVIGRREILITVQLSTIAKASMVSVAVAACLVML